MSLFFENISDTDFINIIQSYVGWEDITKALGYVRKPSNYTVNKIYQRCISLGIKPQLKQYKLDLNTSKRELLNRRKNYQSYRSAIRKHAERIFDENKKERKCHVCGYDKHVEIAHIKPVSAFKDNDSLEQINNINNLIALCPNHHWEYDNGLLTI